MPGCLVDAVRFNMQALNNSVRPVGNRGIRTLLLAAPEVPDIFIDVCSKSSTSDLYPSDRIINKVTFESGDGIWFATDCARMRGYVLGNPLVQDTVIWIPELDDYASINKWMTSEGYLSQRGPYIMAALYISEVMGQDPDVEITLVFYDVHLSTVLRPTESSLHNDFQNGMRPLPPAAYHNYGARVRRVRSAWLKNYRVHKANGTVRMVGVTFQARAGEMDLSTRAAYRTLISGKFSRTTDLPKVRLSTGVVQGLEQFAIPPSNSLPQYACGPIPGDILAGTVLLKKTIGTGKKSNAKGVAGNNDTPPDDDIRDRSEFTAAGADAFMENNDEQPTLPS